MVFDNQSISYRWQPSKLFTMCNLKRLILISALFTSLFSVSANESTLSSEAGRKLQTFAGALKSTLKSAMTSGGATAGIRVCNTQAKAIAGSLSTDGWIVSRTSLKPRNPSNSATPWEKAVLGRFEQQKSAGNSIAELVLIEQDEHRFRMIKAIPTGELCLACHGKTIAPELQKTLTNMYPNDLATGFSVGDIRGAFVIEKQLKNDIN